MVETLIAVAGSLVGVVIGSMFTYTFTKHAQVSKALQDARIAAYAKFASALMDYRRALLERWFVDDGASPSPGSDDGVYVTRSSAWGAYFEVQLLAAEDPIRAAARTALDSTSAIKDATDRLDLVSRSDRSRADVEAFIVQSRSDIASYLRAL
ncbi:hypothetical protein AB0301_05105 [Microbacterium profundi]|uniref:Secreted protein n=1 Tax=Microbacterium profundi TaxID=450380 RepID=A0ABV3LEV5_9MICO